MTGTPTPSFGETCPQCGMEIGSRLLACPSCGRLVYAADLKRLAADAERAEQAGDVASALAAWRQARDLLPADTRQAQTIRTRIDDLSRQVDAVPAAASVADPKSPWGKAVAGAGALGLLAWKFKFIVVFVLSKAKFLLLGLTKASTFFSMFLALAAYWTVWGWRFALGFVISIYIHEMGHVAALRRYGLRASPPMFIPFVGAVVRLQQHPANAREDARIGLAGPLYGLAAAAAAYGVFVATDVPLWAALARAGAWINLFNLLPLWPLDGGRGFQSLTRLQRWLAVACLAAAYAWTNDGMLLLLCLVGMAQAVRPAPSEPDRLGLAYYIFLVLALTTIYAVAHPGGDLPPIPLDSGNSVATVD